MNMLLAVLGTLGASSALAAWGVAPRVAAPGVQTVLGRFRAGLLGIALCMGAMTAVFWWLNPDGFHGAGTQIVRLKEAAMFAAAAGLGWLPVFLSAYRRRLERQIR